MIKFITIFLVMTVAMINITSLTFAAETEQDEAKEENKVLDNVLVTVQKREQAPEDVPASVSAFYGDMVDNGKISFATDLDGYVPSAKIGTSEGQSRIFLRGVGFSQLSIGGDSSVAFHVDGLLMSRPSAQLSAFYDIERIEVLRGPQGSLYGRNATAGSVNVITRGPTEDFEARLTTSFGNYNAITIDGAIGGQLGDSGVLSRFAFKKHDRDGYGKSITTGAEIDNADTFSARWKLLFSPAENIDVNLAFDYHKEDDSNYGTYTIGSAHPMGLFGIGPALVLPGATTTEEAFQTTTEAAIINDREFKGFSATIDWEINDIWSVKSITGYREGERVNNLDVDGTNLPLGNMVRTEDQDQLTQELHVVFSGEKLNGLMGAYWHDESITGGGFLDMNFVACDGCYFQELGTVDIEALGLFAHLNYRLTDSVNITAGLRYSDEERNTVGAFSFPFPEGTFTGGVTQPGVAYGVPGVFSCVLGREATILGMFSPEGPRCQGSIPVELDKSWDAWTPEIKLDYSFDSGTMIYASLSEGFKSGLILVGSPNPPVNPEELISYEVGLKTRLMENTVQLDVSGFFYDYTDLQVGIVKGERVVTENAASAEVTGVEFELRALLSDTFSLTSSGAWIDGTFNEFITDDPLTGIPDVDLSGNQMPNSPELSFNLGLIYENSLNDGFIETGFHVAWKDDVYFDPYNRAQTMAKANTILNANVAYTTANDKWRFEIYGKNLTDEVVGVDLNVGASAFFFPVTAVYNEPRIYGLRVQYQY